MRPPAISPDGRLLFQHLDGLNGFKVADLQEREVVATVRHSRSLGWFLLPLKKLGWLGPHGLNRCHGLAVRPGAAEVWSACGERVNVHRIAETGYPEIHSIGVPDDAYWLTFSPDGRYAFVAITQRDAVAMVDARTRRVVRMLEVGDGPKRNLVLSAAGAPASTRASDRP